MKTFANHTTKLAGILLTLFIAVALMSTTTQTRVTEVPLGTVILNMIPPEIFLAEEENKGWAFLNGQQMNKSWELTARINSEYDNSVFEHLREKLPDARGQFLRSMNHGGYGLDTWKDRKVGVSQRDYVKKHTHNYSFKINKSTRSQGSHYHTFDVNHSRVNFDGFNTVATTAQAFSSNRWLGYITGSKGNINGQVNNTLYGATDRDGSHSHSFSINHSGTTSHQKEWKTETRPVNLGLYAYIKVD